MKNPLHNKRKKKLPKVNLINIRKLFLILCVVFYCITLFTMHCFALQHPFSSINYVSVFSPQEDGFAVVVTCLLTLKKDVQFSPKIEVTVLDKKGRALKSKTSYGGQLYDLTKFQDIDRLTAFAITASPEPVPLNKKKELVYQFVFYDVSKRMGSVQALVVQEELAAKGVGPSSSNQPLEKVTTPISLATKKPLSAVLPVVGEEKNCAHEALTAAGHPSQANDVGPHYSPDKALAILEPLGFLPLWEFLPLGLSPKDVSQALNQRLYPGLKKVEIHPVACVDDICEYALKNIPSKLFKTQLYFKAGRLQSFLIVLAEQNSAEREKLFGNLVSIYGGNIDYKSTKSTDGNTKKSMEYSGKKGGLILQTTGKYFRCYAKEN